MPFIRSSISVWFVLFLILSCGKDAPHTPLPSPLPPPPASRSAALASSKFYDTHCWMEQAWESCQRPCGTADDCCSREKLGCTSSPACGVGGCTYTTNVSQGCACMPGECSPDGAQVCTCGTDDAGTITASHWTSCPSEFPTCDSQKRRCVCRSNAPRRCADGSSYWFCDLDGGWHRQACPSNTPTCDPTSAKCTCPAGVCGSTCGCPAGQWCMNNACAPCPTYFRDQDNDGYGSGPALVACGPPPSGYVAKGGDCCDTEPRAFPGQTAYFSNPVSGCGGYDYDCDGALEFRPFGNGKLPIKCDGHCPGNTCVSTFRPLGPGDCGQTTAWEECSNQCHIPTYSCRHSTGTTTIECR